MSLTSTNDHPSFTPLGPRLTDFTPSPPPSHTPIHGKHVSLIPTTAAHAASLYTHLCGPTNESLWTFLGAWGPFNDLASFTTHLTFWLTTPKVAVLYSITLTNAPNDPCGLIGFINFRPAPRDIEIGPAVFGPALQRTIAATEALTLMLKRAFEECNCRRVGWECNALNLRSRRAAERVGFVFEGLWRQSDIVKGRNRDTAWFSVLDREWDGVWKGFERWVDGVDGMGRQSERLEEARRAVREAVVDEDQ